MPPNLPPLPAYDHASIFPHAKVMSSSQLKLALDSFVEFTERYVLGVPMDESKALKFGRLFAACYADRGIDPQPYFAADKLGPTGLLDAMRDALRKLPRLPGGEAEHAIFAEVPGTDWKIRVTLDDWCPERRIDREVKTGGVPWTQERADNDFQVSLQCLALALRDFSPPSVVELQWFSTKQRGVGGWQTFKTNRTAYQLAHVLDTIRPILRRIDDAYETKG